MTTIITHISTLKQRFGDSLTRMENDTVRLLIIAKDPLARAGLAGLLDQQSYGRVVGQVDGERSLPDDIDVYQPELILFDLGWEAEATPAQLSILEQLSIPVIVLLPDETAATTVWRAGVQGLLLRDSSAEKIETALHAVYRHLTVIDPELTGALSSDPTVSPNQELLEPLTPREMEVLQHLAEGLPNKTIAHRLEISEHTVKFHVNAIMGKLGAQSRTEAVVRATQFGLIML